MFGTVRYILSVILHNRIKLTMEIWGLVYFLLLHSCTSQLQRLQMMTHHTLVFGTYTFCLDGT